MLKRFLIVASKKDLAGTNITTQLSQFGTFNFYLVEEDILHNEHLNLLKFEGYDFVVFASKHSSKAHTKTLSIHAPGNFSEAKMGGESRKACVSSALFQKHLFAKLHEYKEEFHLESYGITMEATHHGPLINIPCLFLEIGSTEDEWKDRRAGFVVAKALHEAIKTFEPSPYNEIAVGIGGPHYCPNFNKMQLNSNIAISHIISQYNIPFTREAVLEAIKKTYEEVDFVVLDWKGLGGAEERKALIELLDANYIQWKRSGEIDKS